MARVSHQGKLPRLDPCQIGITKVSNQQRRVMHRRFNRAQHVRITGQCRARQNDLLAIDGIVVRTFSRETGDLVANRQVIDTIANRRHDAGHFMAKA
ncbi:hypothetical protein D3C84_842660 [compost metagenome]